MYIELQGFTAKYVNNLLQYVQIEMAS